MRFGLYGQLESAGVAKRRQEVQAYEDQGNIRPKVDSLIEQLYAEYGKLGGEYQTHAKEHAFFSICVYFSSGKTGLRQHYNVEENFFQNEDIIRCLKKIEKHAHTVVGQHAIFNAFTETNFIGQVTPNFDLDKLVEVIGFSKEKNEKINEAAKRNIKSVFTETRNYTKRRYDFLKKHKYTLKENQKYNPTTPSLIGAGLFAGLGIVAGGGSFLQAGLSFASGNILVGILCIISGLLSLAIGAYAGYKTFDLVDSFYNKVLNGPNDGKNAYSKLNSIRNNAALFQRPSLPKQAMQGYSGSSIADYVLEKEYRGMGLNFE